MNNVREAIENLEAVKMLPDYQIKNVKLYNVDCMEFMKQIPDNYYNLAVVDPPYGIGMGKIKRWSTSKKLVAPSHEYAVKEWDNNIPNEEYFKELFRISKNQIIWGGNYFVKYLRGSQGWIIWDKKNDGMMQADCEMAFTSFDKATRIFRFMWRGCFTERPVDKKIHICQKPKDLYKWMLTNYAEKGDKIFDSHGGSFSSASACLDMGFDFDGCEIDKEYFDNAVKRLKNNNQEYLI